MRGFLVVLTISSALLFLSNIAVAEPIIIDEETHIGVTLPTDDAVVGSLILCEGPVNALGHCAFTNENRGFTFSDAVQFGGSSADIHSDGLSDPRELPDPLTGQLDSPADLLFLTPRCRFDLCTMVAETADANGQETIVYTPRAGEPGFSPSVPLTYVITSDPAPAPEPPTFALGGVGMLPLALGYLKRRGVKKRRLKS